MPGCRSLQVTRSSRLLNPTGSRPITHLPVEVLRRPVEPGQYTSFRFTQHLVDTGIDASIGTVGDALDNVLAESTIGLYKTELIKPNGPWHNIGEVDIATERGWIGTTIGDFTEPAGAGHRPSSRLCGSWAT
jgi:transposase InsO family protein